MGGASEGLEMAVCREGNVRRWNCSTRDMGNPFAQRKGVIFPIGRRSTVNIVSPAGELCRINDIQR